MHVIDCHQPEAVGGGNAVGCAIASGAAAFGVATAASVVGAFVGAIGAFGASINCMSEQGGSGSNTGSLDYSSTPWHYLCGA